MSSHLSDLDGNSPISSVATFNVDRAKTGDDLTTLARQMTDAHVGALLVEDHQGNVGILTERDIVRSFATDASAWAADCMTRDLITVPGSHSIADTAEMMLVAEVRHIVVERDDGVLGIASVRDLLRPLIDGHRD